MTKSAKPSNRRTLLKFLVLVVCVLSARAWLRIPRTGWSAKDSSRPFAMPEDVRRVVDGDKDIRGIILISIDTLRADHLGCYEYSRNTSPNIDDLAAEGILFNHVVSPIPYTLPAHCSMMTGTNPYYHQVHDNLNFRLDDSNITLAELLKSNGFVTGAIIGAFALDGLFGLDQGFDTYDDDINADEQIAKLSPFTSERKADEVTELAQRWLNENGSEKFFLFVHYYDVHHPYQWHDDTAFKYPFLVPSFKDAYDSEIAYTDGYVGKIIDTLKQRGLYDSSLIVVVGDHGESLTEHKEATHGFFVYHSSIHVPLVVKVPGLSRKVRNNDVVGIIDIVPTICHLLGIEPPEAVEGRSLLADAHQDGQRMIYCESMKPTEYNGQSLLGLAGKRYKYIHTTRPELYDLWDDPHEAENIIDECPEIAARFEARLLSTVTGMDARPGGSKITLDAEARARLAALGYVGGSIETDFDLAGAKEDPKDIIEFHENWEKVYIWISSRNYAKLKAHILDAISERPDFYDSLMSTVAHTLATDTDPEVLDPQAAIAIARHGVAMTESRDWYSLRALTEAYKAAGRSQEAQETARMLRDLTAETASGATVPPLPTHLSPRKRFENEK